MTEILPTSPLIYAVMVFFIAVVSKVVVTFRLLLAVRGYKLISSVLVMVHALLFIFVLGSVVSDLDNFWNVLAYAAGLGLGSYLGIFLEAKLAIGYSEVRIISTDIDNTVAKSLGDHGYGATETFGKGRKGPVQVTVCIVRRREIPRVEALALASDRQCFITVEDIKSPRKTLWQG